MPLLFGSGGDSLLAGALARSEVSQETMSLGGGEMLKVSGTWDGNNEEREVVSVVSDAWKSRESESATGLSVPRIHSE